MIERVERRRTSMKVVRAVKERGLVSIDDLADIFPEHTRGYIGKALSNAKHLGLVRLVRRGSSSRYNRVPGLWGVADATDAQPKIASVFDLASPRPLPLPDLPGRKYEPLGPWSELEGAAAS